MAERVTYKGQDYVLLGTYTYKTKDGETIVLAEWETHCVRCGVPFRFKSGLFADKTGNMNRRCSEHKRPGAKVQL